MTATKCDRFNVLALPLFPMLLMSWLNLVREETMLVIFLVFVSCGHLHFGVNVVSYLNKSLNCNDFAIL